MEKGLQEASQFKVPIFTPSTKAEFGQHDENISITQLVESIGSDYAQKIEKLGLEIYLSAREYARDKGIIIADTKFEFGVDENGTLHLADEVLSPDSSRFWPNDGYKVGIVQPSFIIN